LLPPASSICRFAAMAASSAMQFVKGQPMEESRMNVRWEIEHWRPSTLSRKVSWERPPHFKIFSSPAAASSFSGHRLQFWWKPISFRKNGGDQFTENQSVKFDFFNKKIEIKILKKLESILRFLVKTELKFLK
jgi:hypothetical protein